jgi:hypothetical protein
VEPGKSRAARAGLLFEVSIRGEHPPRLRPNNGLAPYLATKAHPLELDRRALVLIALTAALGAQQRPSWLFCGCCQLSDQSPARERLSVGLNSTLSLLGASNVPACRGPLGVKGWDPVSTPKMRACGSPTSCCATAPLYVTQRSEIASSLPTTQFSAGSGSLIELPFWERVVEKIWGDGFISRSMPSPKCRRYCNGRRRSACRPRSCRTARRPCSTPP